MCLGAVTRCKCANLALWQPPTSEPRFRPLPSPGQPMRKWTPKVRGVAAAGRPQASSKFGLGHARNARMSKELHSRTSTQQLPPNSTGGRGQKMGPWSGGVVGCIWGVHLPKMSTMGGRAWPAQSLIRMTCVRTTLKAMIWTRFRCNADLRGPDPIRQITSEPRGPALRPTPGPEKHAIPCARTSGQQCMTASSTPCRYPLWLPSPGDRPGIGRTRPQFLRSYRRSAPLLPSAMRSCHHCLG